MLRSVLLYNNPQTDTAECASTEWVKIPCSLLLLQYCGSSVEMNKLQLRVTTAMAPRGTAAEGQGLRRCQQSTLNYFKQSKL